MKRRAKQRERTVEWSDLQVTHVLSRERERENELSFYQIAHTVYNLSSMCVLFVLLLLLLSEKRKNTEKERRSSFSCVEVSIRKNFYLI
jgi:hypothetical protein